MVSTATTTTTNNNNHPTNQQQQQQQPSNQPTNKQTTINQQHEHVQGVLGLLNNVFWRRWGRGVCTPRFRAPQLLGGDFIPKDSLAVLRYAKTQANSLSQIGISCLSHSPDVL